MGGAPSEIAATEGKPVIVRNGDNGEERGAGQDFELCPRSEKTGWFVDAEPLSREDVRDGELKAPSAEGAAACWNETGTASDVHTVGRGDGPGRPESDAILNDYFRAVRKRDWEPLRKGDGGPRCEGAEAQRE